MSGKDAKGYYARLGIDPSSDTETIKTAYRRFAKEFHPDRNPNAQSKARFQAINEAYQTLSNPERRAAYDALGYTAKIEEPINRILDPICCSRCHKVTAQPRAVVFRYVVSAIFVTMRNPVQGIFCSSCARRSAIKASIISAVAGWWGFPWGPIYTIGVIWRNSTGGDYSVDSEEKMLWYNALAFLSQGNTSLSYALAQQLRFAANTEIADKASRLLDHLKALGISTVAGLKNPWAVEPLDRLAHIVLICALPLLVIAVSCQDELRAWWTGQPVTKQIYQSSKPFAPPPNVMNSYSSSGPDHTAGIRPPSTAVEPQTVPTCSWSPTNGQILAGRLPVNGRGHTLEIRNGSGGNAIVKARDSYGRLVVSFFIATNNSAEVTDLPDGDYQVQYAFGSKLRRDCQAFITLTAAGQFPGVERLRTEYTSTQIVRSRLSYTLYSVPSGNVRPQGISAAAFEAD